MLSNSLAHCRSVAYYLVSGSQRVALPQSSLPNILLVDDRRLHQIYTLSPLSDNPVNRVRNSDGRSTDQPEILPPDIHT